MELFETAQHAASAQQPIMLHPVAKTHAATLPQMPSPPRAAEKEEERWRQACHIWFTSSSNHM
jgi:hypothetical protein